MGPQYALIYVTVSGIKEARSIGRALVKQRLCACVNILNKMESLYWWKGRLETGHEAVLTAKTRRTLAPRVVRTIKKLHSYECPCIVTLPITGGYSGFLDWIKAETRV